MGSIYLQEALLLDLQESGLITQNGFSKARNASLPLYSYLSA